MATYGQINADNLTSSTGGVISPNITSLRNRIINGAMSVSQYNGTSSVNIGTSGAGSQYAIDRWNFDFSQAPKLSAQQSTNAPTGFYNSLLVTSLAATTIGTSDYFQVNQKIEAFNTTDLAFGTANAQSVTLSFWVYSSLTGSFSGALKNSAQSRAYPFSYTISSASTWTQISITIPGDTSGTWIVGTNGIGLTVNFDLGIGTTYVTTGGAWASGNYGGVTGSVNLAATNGATWYVTGVQLEKGAQATSFDYRPYGTELALCQRYYFQNTGLASTTTNFGSATSISATQAYIQVPFPVSMRTGPTISYGGTVNVSDSNTYDLAISAIVTNQSNTNYGSGKVTTASGQTLYRPQTLWVNSTASFLAFTAEL